MSNIQLVVIPEDYVNGEFPPVMYSGDDLLSMLRQIGELEEEFTSITDALRYMNEINGDGMPFVTILDISNRPAPPICLVGGVLGELKVRVMP